MSIDKVFNVKLLSGEDLLAVYVGQTADTITFHTPMTLGEVLLPSCTTHVLLYKYLGYSKKQLFNISKNHLLCMSEVQDEVAKFYFNTIKYQSLHGDPYTFGNIVEVNKYMDQVLSKDNILFDLLAKQLHIDLNQIDYTKPN